MELKLSTLGLIFITIMIISLYGCTNNFTSKTVKLNLNINEWSFDGKPKIRNLIVEVKEGDDFGPQDFIAAPESKPFKLVEVIDENSIKIQFDSSLVVAGEPVNYPSKQNPIIISLKETCFNTRSHDAGTSICLKITK